MRLFLSSALVAAAVSAHAAELSAPQAHWSRLPSVPDEEGFAAPFAGVAGGALVVAGGANIVGDKWADAFTKTWYDSVFVLERPDGAWRKAGRLPRPLGYGVSCSIDDSLICAGGSDAQRHYAEVFRLRWRHGALEQSALPPLPKPCANACGALIGKTLYIAGGIEGPSATTALKTFWALDLGAEQPQWRELDPWPGPERMLAVAGVLNGDFYLFSGVRLTAGPDGKPAREYLRDAYRFTRGRGWQALPEMPRAAVAAASPALPTSGALLVVSGDDGTQTNFKPLPKHPGFPRDALAFSPKRNAWSTAGEAPFSRATVPVVEWCGGFVIPNGEVRPRERTPEVWRAVLQTTDQERRPGR